MFVQYVCIVSMGTCVCTVLLLCWACLLQTLDWQQPPETYVLYLQRFVKPNYNLLLVYYNIHAVIAAMSGKV